MGVTGLWGILEPTGKPVRIQNLKGKVLSVDVSIWLHQAVKGFRDKDGNPIRNAHLLGVFHRVCKLLSHGIKPIFVFDGGVPALKKQTMSVRRQRKIEAQDKSHVSRNKLLQNLLKQQLQKQYLTDLPPTDEIEEEVDRILKSSEQATKKAATQAHATENKKVSKSNNKKFTSPQKQPKSKIEEEFDDHFGKFREKLTENFNNFALFFNELDKQNRSDSDSEDSDSDSKNVNGNHNYGHRDYDENFSSIVSPTFDELPLEVQHDMLFDMQESKKNNSWGKIDQMPKDLQNFSSFQMDRLRKRRTLQKKIQSVQQEMGQRHIHLSNFDDLAAFNYEDIEGKDTKVLGSKEKGLLYVATAGASTSSEKQEAVPGPSSSSQKQSESTKGPGNVITIDDFITEGWSSSDDESRVPLPSSNKRTIEIQAKTPELTEEEQLQQAIRLSLAQQETESSAPEASTSTKFNTGEATGLTKEKPVGIVSPFQNPRSQSLASFSSDSGVCVNHNSNESSLSSTEKMLTISNSTIKDASESSSSSESEFEEVTGDADFDESEEKKPELDLKAIFDGVKEKQEPILTIDVTDQDSLKAEDDLFADIFEEIKPKTDTENKISNHFRDSVKTADRKSEIEYVEEVSAEDAVKRSQGNEIQFLSNVKASENDSKSESKNNEKGESSDFDSDFENVDIDIIIPEPTAADVNSGTDVGQLNKNQQITRTLGSDPTTSVRMISAQYMQAQEKLVTENEKLMSAKGFQERVATSITDQMYSEAQELLSLFGVPYIISPMEAESQCAFLDIACLTEGTITDDSDIWLFGGQRVYKNFFSQGDRPLEMFQYADIVSKLNLDREKLVLVAILTGSDYTDGVEGVGPVKALEILSEFPSPTISAFDSLVQFREWLEKAQADKNLDKGNQIRNKLRKIKLRSGFPSKPVYNAYVDPTIDDSIEPCRWGQPDLDGLRAYAKNKFGWDQSRCDATLLPLIRTLRCQIEESTRQLSMDSFLTFGERHAAKHPKRKVKSKRLENAMKKLKFPDHSSDVKLSSESESDSNNDDDRDDSDFQNPARPSQQNRQRKNKSQTPKEKADGMDAELKDLLDRMGVRRMTVKRGAGDNKDPNTSTGSPTKIPKKGKQQSQTSTLTLSTAAASAVGFAQSERDVSIPAPSPLVSTPIKIAPKKPQIIHQKVQEEHEQRMQKKKAIELFKSKKK